MKTDDLTHVSNIYSQTQKHTILKLSYSQILKSKKNNKVTFYPRQQNNRSRVSKPTPMKHLLPIIFFGKNGADMNQISSSTSI